LDDDLESLWMIPMSDEEKRMMQEMVLETLCEERNDCSETSKDTR
jgi:hypothetical protein